MNMRTLSKSITKVYDDYLNLLYEDITGFDELSMDDDKAYKKQKVHTTYGELEPEGLEMILKYLKIDNKDVFYDFGCGVGKLVLQMLMKTDVRAAFGVEASPSRCKDAKKALRRFKKDLPEFFDSHRKGHFINDNLLHVDISKATVIYVCSTCFSQWLLKAIGKMVNQAPNVRYLISLEPIKNLEMPLIEVPKIKCCWDPKTECYIYSRV